MRPMLPILPVVLLSAVCAAADPQRPVDFNRDIRPILSENCYQCHGPDAEQRQTEMRLDRKESAFAVIDGRAPFVPGKPGQSEVYRRLTSDDPDVRMPPADAPRKPTAAQIELLRRWIEQGAVWKGHWAFIKPELPPVPQVERAGFVRNDVDRFVLARLLERGMQPSPEADRVTLIRRLSFDLTGLPPAPAEVEAFVNDERADAYERLVDRLLESPHYGERMAMYWLDLVRYADTNGIHGDNHRDVALYRDYVIDAFNDNMPFDRFTREQLAGDLLPGGTNDQLVASGYNRLLMTTREGGAQPKEYLAKYAADRVRNASEVWLGATMGCAECHDHKFDPYTMRDFYSFASFFADIKEVAVGVQPPTPIPTPEQQARLDDLDTRIAAVRKVLETQTAALDAAQAEWERTLKEREVVWTPLAVAEAKSRGGAKLEAQDDGALLATGPNPDKDVYTLNCSTELQGITALRLELLPDDSLPAKGPGRAGNGNLVLHELKLIVDAQPVAFSTASATHSQKNFVVASAVDGKPDTGWAILPQAGRAVTGVFELKQDLDATGKTLTLELHQNHGSSHTLGRFRLSVTAAPRPVRAEGHGLPQPIVDILALPAEKRNDKQRQQLAAHYRGIAPLLEPQRKELAQLTQQKTALEKSLPTTLVATAMAPRTMRVLPRGNWLDDSGSEVQPAVPAFLPQLEVEGRATRLELARWLTSPDNPLVARVFVNRLWKLAFGRGIVSTLDDFGAQGAPPTHPALLDWLAVRFVEDGWDVKATMRLLVNSGTYRQSSLADEERRRADPFNQWLARAARYRLDAEVVRDNALAVSGLLVRKIGGKSVKPYQPPGYWAHLNFPRRTYKADTGEDQYRRGLYTYWCRTFLHPSLLAFDAPTREECAVERPRSNTPLQALVLLNDPTYVEAARALAERAVREGGEETAGRLEFLYREVLSRSPREAETKVLTALLEKHRGQYESDAEAAAALLEVGQRAAPKDIPTAELAAWTSVCRVLLNLAETITRS